MSKRIPLAIAIALIFIFSALTVVITVSVYLRSYNKILSSVYERSQQYTALSDVDEIIKNNYYGETDPSSVMSGAARGYVNSLDGECLYLFPDEYDEYSAVKEGDFPGVGLSVEFDSFNNALNIVSVSKGSPADLKGISSGDIIIEADNSEITSENCDALIAKLTGREKNTVILKIKKAADDTVALIELTSVYRLKSVSYQKSGEIGYIKVSAFYDDTVKLFKEAVNELNGEGIKGLIIDVRNNKSFNYSYASDVIDVIVPLATEGNGAIATALDFSGKSVEVYSSDASSVNIPLAVLVNDRTEGAAELLAADLRDFSKAVIIGETSAGNASFQKEFSLDNGAIIVLTVAKICPYISECYDGQGVVPDAVVPMALSQKNALDFTETPDDEQYKTALSALS